MGKMPMSRNKILYNVKWIIGAAYFSPSSVKRGNLHEDKVKFDQVNNTAEEV